MRLHQEAGEATEDSDDGVGMEDGEVVVQLLKQCGLLVEDHHGERWDASRYSSHHHCCPCLHSPAIGHARTVVLNGRYCHGVVA